MRLLRTILKWGKFLVACVLLAPGFIIGVVVGTFIAGHNVGSNGAVRFLLGLVSGRHDQGRKRR